MEAGSEDKRVRGFAFVSVVIPVYNAEKSLPELISRLLPVLAASAPRYEVILVNDGSRDHSWDVIRRLASENDALFGIDLMRNYGQHNALLCGVRAVRGDVVVTLDDDLQHRPEDIPRLLELLSGGADVAYGTPDREQHGAFRPLASRLTKLALRSTMGAESAPLVSPFRAFRTSLREAFAGVHDPSFSLDVLLTWGTTRLAAVRVVHEPRVNGRSRYTFVKLVRHALNMITGFSVLPLRIASLLALVFMLFGFGVLVKVVVRVLLYGSPVPGFPMLASLITMLSAVQLFSLGILGEYLARIHQRTMNNPVYTVRERVGRERA